MTDFVKIYVYTRPVLTESYPDGLARSIHIAAETEEEIRKPFNQNYGILFAEGTVSEENTIVPMGIRNPGIFRMEGGTVYVSAANDALDAKIGMSVSGGSLFAAGSSYRLKSFSPDSAQASLCAELAEAAEGQITVCTSEGTVLDTLAEAGREL